MLTLEDKVFEIFDFLLIFCKNACSSLWILFLIVFVYFFSRGDANTALACLGNLVCLVVVFDYLGQRLVSAITFASYSKDLLINPVSFPRRTPETGFLRQPSHPPRY